MAGPTAVLLFLAAFEPDPVQTRRAGSSGGVGGLARAMSRS
ncbi:MAG: hypothetical protein ACRDPI_09605 [Nocardioidaceae bacterium]